MKLFTPLQYKFDCPSCGLPLELVVTKAEDGKEKWIKSAGLKWPVEMRVGGFVGAYHNWETAVWDPNDHLCECTLCRTEYNREDFDKLAKPITGSLKFKDGDDGKKQNKQPDS